MTKQEDAQAHAIEEIRKRFGAGSIFWGDDVPVENVKAISTGSLGLDIATGIGGLGRGKMTEIHGAESSGKTTITLQAVREAQKQGLVGFCDMEHALDRKYAESLGVDFNKLAFSQPDYGEQCLEIADALMRAGAVMVVIDSIPALTPKDQIDGEYEDKNYGAIAHLLSRSLGKLKSAASMHDCAIVFTNQMRIDQKGWMPPGATGYPMKTFGGEAPKYFSDMRIKLHRRFDKDKKLEEQIVVATVVKNKLSPPFREAMFNIIYGKGVDTASELADIAVEREIIKRNGGWYSRGEVKLQGLDAVVELLKTDKKFYSEIYKAVMG